jgi:hypothetical protein
MCHSGVLPAPADPQPLRTLSRTDELTVNGCTRTGTALTRRMHLMFRS